MDVWRLDFSVRNGSGRWLDHLIARFQIESAWPDCTNWDVPTAYQSPQNIEWAGSIGNIQESGRNVVSPDQTLTDRRYIIVLRGDPEPRFSNWSMDFDFAAAPPTADSATGPSGPLPATPPASAAQQPPPAATPEQENIFWQSILNSTNPAEFEAYLHQFPNGVFRALAEARLAVPRERPDGTPPVGRARVDSTTSAPADGRLPTPDWSIAFGDDTGLFARDGKCADPRFEGAGMILPSGVSGEHGRDATDCRRLYEAGRISLFGVDLDSGYSDFGDDAGPWARDGECDDPRFKGSGMDSMPLDSDRGHDATDCRRLYDAVRIRLFDITIGHVR